MPDGKAQYGNEMVRNTGAGTGLYDLGYGKGVYSHYAPGTKTLASQQEDEAKRAQAVAEALAQKQYELEAAKAADTSALNWYGATNSGGGGSSGSGSNSFSGLTAKQTYDAVRQQQKDVSAWADKIIALTEPKAYKNKDSEMIQNGKNKFYHVGANGGAYHAFPAEALKAYKSQIPADIYNDVVTAVMGHFPSAGSSGGSSSKIADATRQHQQESLGTNPNAYFK